MGAPPLMPGEPKSALNTESGVLRVNNMRLLCLTLCIYGRFKIYMHLFVVMGISWITEGLSKHFGLSDMW